MTHDALRTRDDLRPCVNLRNDSAIHNVYHTGLDTETASKQRVTICPVRMEISKHLGLMTYI